MVNIGNPTQSRRRLMMNAMDSILLYDSEILVDALKVRCRMRILSSLQRTAALRVALAYRSGIYVGNTGNQWCNTYRQATGKECGRLKT